MKPDFGGITRPHGSRSIKNQIRALCEAEKSQNIDLTGGKLIEVVARSNENTIGDPPRE